MDTQIEKTRVAELQGLDWELRFQALLTTIEQAALLQYKSRDFPLTFDREEGHCKKLPSSDE